MIERICEFKFSERAKGIGNYLQGTFLVCSLLYFVFRDEISLLLNLN